MQDFGGYRDLLGAPSRLVQRVILIYQAEAEHQKVKEWQAKVQADWKQQGLTS